MLMSILERTKEIGMLRSLGMTDRELIITYMTEAGFVGLIGSVIGIVLACLINIPLVNPGLDLSAMFEGTNGNTGYRIASIFRSTWRPLVIIGTGVGATLLSAIMAFLPVRRSIKKPVAESLRFE
jgi:ABC-type antimicrobial peptide transport system permease subunit